MTCACCETGRCCDGQFCSITSESECRYKNAGRESYAGPGYPLGVAPGGYCATRACIDLPGTANCTVANYCACAFGFFRTPTSVASCDCRDLQAAGYTNGGCRWRACEGCGPSGTCISTCPSPRECCGSQITDDLPTCCPLSQRCASGTCVNKCATGTFCAGTLGGLNYDCCTSSQKCCGTSGCLATSTASFTVNVAANAWVDTGVTLAAGASVAITATGTVEWAGAGSAATPNGVPADSCGCCDGGSVTSSFCHMALIGRIGTSGTPFLVGSSYSGSPGAGLLYLRQNDTVVGDNSGSFTGTITTDPCPGYTPAAVGEPIVYEAGEEPPKPLPGPGAALKSLLRLAGIVASPNCSCNARAAQMDAWGEWECLKRLPEICGWLKEEAKKRELWFFPPAGVALILAAISLSALKRPFRGTDK